MKDKIMSYLQDRYNTTRFPYLKVSDLTYHLKCYPRKELNELFLEGKITVHPGINSSVIKLINN